MLSQKERNSAETSEVCKFYQGKSLFITGAAGFLGVVLLETLLRCCQDIRKIYILLRPKKGVRSEDRKEEIFKKSIFYKLKETNPGALNKVVVIPGDVCKENLGMCEDDLKKIIQDVSVVFHCAATISFLKPISFIVQQNVMGSHNVIELCRKLQKLEALVYTSTAYSNCTRKHVEEKVYKMPFAAEEIIQKNGNEEELTSLFQMCKPNFPNFYTFSKCVVENLISEKASDLPVCIVRPSIIITTWKGILPGFIEYGSGLVSMSLGIGKGFIRVVKLDLDKVCDQIPVDIVANTHILAAYHQVRDRSSSLKVYNCTSGEIAPFTWGTYIKVLMDMVSTHPLPKSSQKPSFTVCKNSASYWFHSVLDHYIPAIIFDFFLWISGSKLRLLKLYRFYDKNMKALDYFAFNEWKFSCDNFKSLSQKPAATDSEMFYVDLKGFKFEDIAKAVPINSPMYRGRDQKPYEKPSHMPFYYYINFASLIKWAVLVGMVSIFYVI